MNILTAILLLFLLITLFAVFVVVISIVYNTFVHACKKPQANNQKYQFLDNTKCQKIKQLQEEKNKQAQEERQIAKIEARAKRQAEKAKQKAKQEAEAARRKALIEERRKERSGLRKINMDKLNGREFELYCSKILSLNGFSFVQTTQCSGDQGIDIVARKNGKRYGIQCKRYSSNIGNHAVQEVYAGGAFYKCDIVIVMTNQHFTKSATELARRTGVILWDRDTISKMI